tara:strand:- start:1083 stop:1364 length:282 start_codon:yes stop_codon:yes gene_type:complete
MKKWEYKTLYVGQHLGGETHTGEEFEKVLNEFGDQGRECVGHGMTDSRKVYIYSKVSKALISTQLPSKHYFFLVYHRVLIQLDVILKTLHKYY